MLSVHSKSHNAVLCTADLVCSIRTLIQILTMDNVDDIMRINMLSCVHSGYDSGLASYDSLCSPNASGMGWLSPLYFITFTVSSAFIMITALIGLIMSAMENLMEIKNSEAEIWEDVAEVAEAYEIAECAIPWLLELFEKLDLDANAHLTIVQLQPLLRAVDIYDEQEQFTIFVKVDRDGSGQIEFPEFCEVVSIIGLLLKKTPLAAKKVAKARKFETVEGGTGVLGALAEAEHDQTDAGENRPPRSASVSPRPGSCGSGVGLGSGSSLATSVRAHGDSTQALLASQKSPAVRKALRLMRGQSRNETIESIASFAITRLSKNPDRDLAVEEMNDHFDSDSDEDSDAGPVTAFVADFTAFVSSKISGKRSSPGTGAVFPANAGGDCQLTDLNDYAGVDQSGVPRSASSNNVRGGAGHVDSKDAEESLRKSPIILPPLKPKKTSPSKDVNDSCSKDAVRAFDHK
jgi:hypothetical protein